MAEGFAAFKNYQITQEDVESQNLEFVDTRPHATKTPISFLQELCVKKQVTPIYELLASEGRVHEPTFVYRVIVSDLSAVGQGKSKKEAKHVAAKKLLEHIVARDLYQEWLLVGDTQEEALDYLHSIIPEIVGSKVSPKPTVTVNGHNAATVSADVSIAIDLANTSMEETDALGSNPIGRLQEMCSIRHWPPPRYELIEESGMPHDKTFVITIYLGKFEQSGNGKSKKTAKRIAAEKMLKFLNDLPEHKQDAELLEDENQGDDADVNAEAPNSELDVQLTQLGADMQQWGFGCVVDAIDEVIPPPRTVELAEMDLTKMEPSEALKKLLDDISVEENWTVKYDVLDRRGKNGQYQCLVNFADAAVCHGMGASREEAIHSAAKRALEYIKVINQT